MRMDLEILKDTPPWEWSRTAGETFREILRDRSADASDRLIAAELAGDMVVVNDEGVDVLLSIVCSRDEPEELRGRAAISLGPVLETAEMCGFEDELDLDEVPITEQTFHEIQKSLRQLYMDAEVPKEVRRRILEASVRAPQDWHRDAIRAAYASDDEEWKLTAVFAMQYVRGFDEQILEALESGNPDIHYEAVCAAGNWELDAAWPHIAALVTSADTDRDLLLAAIEAVASIRPRETGLILVDLTDSDDEEVVEAAYDAMAMAEGAVRVERAQHDEDEEDEEEEDEDSLR